MKTFAIIKNSFVENIVVWDGEGDFFPDAEVMEVKDGDLTGIGDAVVDGKVYARPGDGYEYQFDTTSLKWNLTEEGQQQKYASQLVINQDKKDILINSAKDKISLWQSELLLGKISDKDKSSLNSWIDYIKALHDIDASKPDVTWPDLPQ